MQRGDRREIEVDGRKVSARYLGAGAFCRAFQADDDGRVYCYVRDGEDYSKEMFCGGPCAVSPSPHLPNATKHEDVCIRGRWWNLYSMPYYAPLTAASAGAWAVFKALRDARAEWLRCWAYHKPLESYGCDLNRAVVEETRGRVPASITAALDDLANTACNYGAGMTFEFAPRNLGVNADGGLVLRDCVFDAGKAVRRRRRVA